MTDVCLLVCIYTHTLILVPPSITTPTGRQLYLRFGGEEVEFDPGFRLYLQVSNAVVFAHICKGLCFPHSLFSPQTNKQTKLPNPHYKPEVAAQCTLVNFLATEKGLEDQLLSKARRACVMNVVCGGCN